MRYIRNGWPKERNEIEHEVRDYFAYNDELTISDGIVFRKE